MNGITSTLLAATLMGPMIVGCGAQGPLENSVPGLPADFTGPGVYTVPADPTVPFAVSKVDIEQGDGIVSVYYDLPPAFPALAPKVKLTGMADQTDTVQLSGPAGMSKCTLSAALFECHEQLSGIRFGPSVLPLDDRQRAAVEAFIGDPVGVLSVTLPQ